MATIAPSASAVSVPVRPVARPRAVAVSAGGRWWAPLLGWSGRADYLEAPAPVVVVRDDAAAAAVRRQFVGGLTEEKARELRVRMMETESFHDAMYHSAIASRLARSV